MGKRTVKATAIAALTGCLLQFGGCYGDSWFGQLLSAATLSVGYDYIWDTEAVLDLFASDSNNLARH